MAEWQLQTGEPDLSLVDRIPWIELEHAYGAAIDVPDQLRKLLSPDLDVRRNILFGFTCNIYHQGSTYSATVAAIPVLQHLLQYQQVPDRFRILEFLAGIASRDDDQLTNVSPLDDLRPSEEEEEYPGDCWRECFLAIGAGASLYELLLGDDDPRVVISTAYLLSLIPAQAFESSRLLPALAEDASRHEFVRSAALISLSYLSGGAVSTEYDSLLAAVVVEEGAGLAEEPLPLLNAAATYCVLRDQRHQLDLLRPVGMRLAARASEHGVSYPDCDFYHIKNRSPDDQSMGNPLDIFVPEPAFPWNDLVRRLQTYSKYRPSKPAIKPSFQNHGPDPRAYFVLEDVFDRDNVVNAVRRLHACFRGTRRSVPLGEFEPFKDHAFLAWDVILGLLDSEVIEDRWAAAHVIEYIAPLDEGAIDQLIERLHRNDNSCLDGAIRKHPVTVRQCQLMCDLLCSRDYPNTDTSSCRQSYQSLVIEHGSNEQIRQLFEKADFPEKLAAVFELIRREQIDPDASMPVLAQGLLMRNHQARWAFSRWSVAHQWFIDRFESLTQEQCWAICDVMTRSGTDLSEHQETLFNKAESTTQPALIVSVIGLMANFAAPELETVNRLMALRRSESHVAVRRAIIRTLGAWRGRGVDEVLIARLHLFVNDASTRVRMSVIDELAKFVDHDSESLRSFLGDADTEICRHAMWLLCRVGKLAKSDLVSLIDENPSDRLVSEALLAAATINAAELANMTVPTTSRGPLTRSVAGWLTASAPS